MGKIALCFYGLAGGIGDKEEGLPVDCDISSKYIKKHLIENNDMDIFIHTWSTDKKDILTKLYNLQVVFLKTKKCLMKILLGNIASIVDGTVQKR